MGIPMGRGAEHAAQIRQEGEASILPVAAFSGSVRENHCQRHHLQRLGSRRATTPLVEIRTHRQVQGLAKRLTGKDAVLA
jgi:hypothetical protein